MGMPARYGLRTEAGSQPSTAAAKDVGDPAGLLSEDVGIDPEGDRRVGVAQARSHDVHRHTGQQQLGGMKVAQVVQPGARQAGLGDQLRHQRGRRVGAVQNTDGTCCSSRMPCRRTSATYRNDPRERDE
jgi:hypothetical protein